VEETRDFEIGMLKVSAR